MKFVDLFAGLGGFHSGFSKAGFECVFASELDSDLRKLYKRNYGIEANGDITKINEKSIPSHDVICAGFPCQPFSLAGQKKGAKCPSSGKLIEHVHRIAKYHNPKFIVLENVPNILTIEEGGFWEYIETIFLNIGYQFTHKIMSPIEFGIPQNRKRVFIVGAKDKTTLDRFEWPQHISNTSDFSDLLDFSLPHKKLELRKKLQIQKWQHLLNRLKQKQIGSISLVAPEFGATYPIDFKRLTLNEIKKYKGAYGADLSKCKSWIEVFSLLPSYTRKKKRVSDWLKKSVIYSRKIYYNNTRFIDNWKVDLDKEFNSWQILEWRGNRENLNIFDHLIQFRASGIRVLKRQIAPSLIAMTPTQIPVVPSEMRYLSQLEAAKLQGMEGIELPSERTNAFKALGNAVNAKIAYQIAHEIAVTQ